MFSISLLATADMNAPYFNDPPDIFKPYIDAKDLEITYKKKYEEYLRKSYGVTWLKQIYNCVIMGPADNFNGDDITNVYALDELENYIVKGGNMLVFHDLLSKQATNGSRVFTSRVRKYFGMDRYQATGSYKEGEYYVKYTTPDDAHFISSLSYWPNETHMVNVGGSEVSKTKYETWDQDMFNAHAVWDIGDGADTSIGSYQKYFTATQYTDLVAMSNDNSGNNVGALAYRYVDADWSYMAAWNHSHPFDSRTIDVASADGKSSTNPYGTNRASKNNDGIITLFPFTLADELYIGGTHSQAFALDIEHPDMTVWYSLAGADNKKQGSSYYAADPRDGIDNYFIYSYGNVSFCGAGHSFVTGPGRNNNDERMLYINIICNSVRKSVNGPSLKIYDLADTTEGTTVEKKNDVIKELTDDANADYETSVKSMEAYPEFSFEITGKATDIKIKNVRIYYDLGYSETNPLNEYTTATFDDNFRMNEEIGYWNENSIKNNEVKLNTLKNVNKSLREETKTEGNGTTLLNNLRNYHDDDDWNKVLENEPEGFYPTALKLKPRYFSYYNNEYTYIVVAVTYTDQETKATSTIYKRIKVKILPYLYDLT